MLFEYFMLGNNKIGIYVHNLRYYFFAENCWGHLNKKYGCIWER